MNSNSFKMGKLYRAALLALTVFTSVILYSCDKNDKVISKKNNPSSYSSHVLDKWMTMQLRLMRNATGIPNHGFARHFAYTGVAAMESLEPGLHGKKEWTNKWNGLTGLPSSDHSKNYFYPANVNAAMATINKLMFLNASEADKAAIDSLEAALKVEFAATQSHEMITVSSDYGKAVATSVFNWAETDGYKNANNPYTAPVGPGLWKPTPPAMAAPATPYWGNNRTVIVGSITSTQPVLPPVYSTDPTSPFYKMVKEVYDASQTLTDDQKAMAIFWRDVPGATSPGHWLSILQQIVKIKNSSLDQAALAYALAGAALNDASITCFKAKYEINLVRPVTYIREVMGHTTWSPYLGTPAHPEYVSAHSSISAAAANVLEKLFGSMTFTDRTYDYMGFAPRTYANLQAIAMEAGQSRLYAGIHYTPSILAGITQGNKVGDNIIKK